jgi:HK97 gp10 family phage protein
MAVQRIFITGVDRIDRALKLLPMKVQKKIIRPAIRDGLKLVKAETEAQVPVDTGLTKDSIKIKAVAKRKTGRIALLVQISGKVPGLIKTSAAGKRGFYPAFVEYGSAGHPPNPFMRRAYTSAGPAARNLTMQRILEGTEREAAKP